MQLISRITPMNCILLLIGSIIMDMRMEESDNEYIVAFHVLYLWKLESDSRALLRSGFTVQL